MLFPISKTAAILMQSNIAFKILTQYILYVKNFKYNILSFFSKKDLTFSACCTL